jgi:formylglycine-generating enzyme required for sulfatase activity
VEALAVERRGELNASPGTFRPDDAWELCGQPGGLPVDSVSWNQCQQWLEGLNGWLAAHWPHWAEQHPELGPEPVRFALPSESQWEVACRGDAKHPTPFHFGATLDGSWARYDDSFPYGRGRKGARGKQPWTNGSSGLVNRWGLAELHGQLFEWCADLWNRDPRPAVQRQRGLFGSKGDAGTAPVAGVALEQPDPALQGNMEQRFRLLRGGSWFLNPHVARTAFRNSSNPDYDNTNFGLRPCCPSPQAPFLALEPFCTLP